MNLMANLGSVILVAVVAQILVIIWALQFERLKKEGNYEKASRKISSILTYAIAASAAVIFIQVSAFFNLDVMIVRAIALVMPLVIYFIAILYNKIRK